MACFPVIVSYQCYPVLKLVSISVLYLIYKSLSIFKAWIYEFLLYPTVWGSPGPSHSVKE